MTKTVAVILAVALLLAVCVHAAATRYQIVRMAIGSGAYRLDRWTGRVSLVLLTGVRPVPEEVPTPAAADTGWIPVPTPTATTNPR